MFGYGVVLRALTARLKRLNAFTSTDSKQAGGNTDDGDIDGTERRTKLARLGTPSLP